MANILNVKLQVMQIVQQSNRGQITFQTIGEDGKPIPTGMSIVVQLASPGEAARYEYGKTYTITIGDEKK